MKNINFSIDFKYYNNIIIYELIVNYFYLINCIFALFLKYERLRIWKRYIGIKDKIFIVLTRVTSRWRILINTLTLTANSKYWLKK